MFYNDIQSHGRTCFDIVVMHWSQSMKVLDAGSTVLLVLGLQTAISLWAGKPPWHKTSHPG